MSKIKQFFRQSGLTKAQLISSLLCYFLCFALFLGIVVIWNPLSLSSTPTEDSQAADGPTNTDGWWIDEGRRGTGFAGGSGTEDDPYLISNAQELAYLSYMVYSGNAPVTSPYYNYVDTFFKQIADIDLSAYYWQPIGISYDRSGSRSNHLFSGNYDGGGHTVSGVFTRAGSGNAYGHQGLFGFIYASNSANAVTIQNLGIIDSFIQGSGYVGGVVGYASSATLTNCYNTGDVNGSGQYIGGVVGDLGSYTTLTNCYNTGTVTGSSGNVGGVVGYARDNTTLTNCFNTGSVSGSSFVGGVVGSTSSSGTITITNCYNTGSVNGFDYYVGGVGGVVGYAGQKTTITNCYNTGSVSDSSCVGGIVGNATGNATITNCYNTGSVSGSSSVGGVVGSASTNSTITNCYYGANCDLSIGGVNGKDTPGQAVFDSNISSNAKTLLWYKPSSNWNTEHPWDFENVWQINASLNDGYPAFLYQEVPIDWWTNEGNYSIEWYNNSDTTTYGDGSAENPYKISTAEDLAGLSYLVYNNAVDAADATQAVGGNAYYIFSNAYFEQTDNIDLSAHVWQPIGIEYDRTGTQTQHYFSGNYDGGGHTVSGINTPAGDTDAYSYQGLFGYYLSDWNQTYEIKNVNIVNSNIKGYNYVGGVVGHCGNADLYLINCSNFGSVSGNLYVGGIIGNSSRLILNCYNGGEIFGNTNVGGISGYALHISKCYNIGKVTGTASVGGVIGFGTAKYCYNQGEVSGTTYVGGIVGGNAQDSSFASRCYNTGIITGNDYVAGIVGYSYSSDGTYDAGDVIAYNINIGQIQGVTNVGQIASACERTQLIKNYFNTGSSVDTVDGATYDSNAENYLHDEDWLYENLFWDIGFTYKISQDAYPTFRTEEEKIHG